MENHPCTVVESLSSPLLTPAFRSSSSQVYGLFEGMLEKLELDDDGKCPIPLPKRLQKQQESSMQEQFLELNVFISLC